MIYVILAVLAGYYAREILDTLKRIERVIRAQNSSEKKNQPKNEATFADPMTKAEVIALMEQEKVDALNR